MKWLSRRRRLVVVALILVGARTIRRSELREIRRALTSRVGWWGGRLRGVAYRLSGGHPALDVDDVTLADRVRSTIGPLEKALDVPRVHVLAEEGIVLLHGEVGSVRDAVAIADAVAVVPGVAGVESYLHVGLVAGDTRPSEGGHRAAPSDARQALYAAARAAGAGDRAGEAVRATLVALANRLPMATVEHLCAHLPADVQALLATQRRSGRAGRLQEVTQLVAAAVSEGPDIPADRAEGIVEAVLGRLRILVPDEAADVASVLPDELRQFWLGAVPG